MDAIFAILVYVELTSALRAMQSLLSSLVKVLQTYFFMKPELVMEAFFYRVFVANSALEALEMSSTQQFLRIRFFVKNQKSIEGSSFG